MRPATPTSANFEACATLVPAGRPHGMSMAVVGEPSWLAVPGDTCLPITALPGALRRRHRRGGVHK